MCSIVQASGQDTSATAALDRKVAAAEESLRTGERQIAESRYRAALLEGWMLVGAIEANRGRLADARHAFERASVSAVENSDALLSLAIVQVQMGDADPAVNTLSRMASASPGNIPIRRTSPRRSSRPENPLKQYRSSKRRMRPPRAIWS